MPTPSLRYALLPPLPTFWARKGDTGGYLCSLPAAPSDHGSLSSPPHRLPSAAAPRIINISVLPGPTHAFRALCTAEGEPPPALTWSGPALGNRSSAALGPGQGVGHQVTAELPALAQDGRYTCTASNSLGRAEASVYLFRFHGASGASTIALLLGALGLKALLLLLGALAACTSRRRRLGGCAWAQVGARSGGAGAVLFDKTIRLTTWHDTTKTSFLRLCTPCISATCIKPRSWEPA